MEILRCNRQIGEKTRFLSLGEGVGKPGFYGNTSLSPADSRKNPVSVVGW